jgi:hypothetical protein
VVTVDDIIDYEDGRMSHEREVYFFADLIGSGAAWTLQGFYGRAAQAYIEAGLISRDGKVLHLYLHSDEDVND